MDHDPHPAETGPPPPAPVGPDDYYVWYVDVPSTAGFPNVMRIPLGVVPYQPPSGFPFLESSQVPDFVANDLPPGAVSDPNAALKDLHSIVDAIFRSAGRWGPL